MNCRIVDMRHKEVICSSNGMRLGFVDDVEVDTANACLVSIVIFGKLKFFGIFGRCDDIIIPWKDIELIGEDTILVRHKCDNRPPKGFGGFPFGGFRRK